MGLSHPHGRPFAAPVPDLRKLGRVEGVLLPGRLFVLVVGRLSHEPAQRFVGCVYFCPSGLPRQPFHQLRHAYATLLLEDGEELANISKMLGHADVSTTANLYAHLTPAITRRAADRMGTILAG